MTGGGTAGGRLGFIAGSGLHGVELDLERAESIQRHGDAYLLPHRIDHGANLRALRDAGCDRVLAVSSVGSLRADLGPGSLLCPDDFIALDADPVTALEGPDAHRVPGFDAEWRARVLAAFGDAGAEIADGGVYWQSRGPRLETPAEIRLVAAHADVIGMTAASECVVAGELGLRYAVVCAVDNFANGVGETGLTLAELDANRAEHRDRLVALIERVLASLG